VSRWQGQGLIMSFCCCCCCYRAALLDFIIFTWPHRNFPATFLQAVEREANHGGESNGAPKFVSKCAESDDSFGLLSGQAVRIQDIGGWPHPPDMDGQDSGYARIPLPRHNCSPGHRNSMSSWTLGPVEASMRKTLNPKL
jgi:hypothetical protein